MFPSLFMTKRNSKNYTTISEVRYSPSVIALKSIGRVFAYEIYNLALKLTFAIGFIS